MDKTKRDLIDSAFDDLYCSQAKMGCKLCSFHGSSWCSIPIGNMEDSEFEKAEDFLNKHFPGWSSLYDEN